MLGPLFVLATAAMLAQEPQAPPPAPGAHPQGEALRVFLDCQYECDLNFLRTEITFVNYVRDRFDAQLLVLVTSQQTGGRGTDFALTFIGQREFQGRDDTLHYIAPQGSTSDEIRRGMARVLRLGCVGYSLRTSAAAHLDVRFTPPDTAAPRERRDPWNRWVFRTSVNSNFNGERSNSSTSWSGSFSANRVTEAWKIETELYGNDSRSRFSYDDTTTFRSKRQSWDASGMVVRSLGAHWSAGMRGGLSGSTSKNTSLSTRIAPAVEYDLFPYAQSTRRQLTVLYAVGIQTASYRDSTIYGRIQETFGYHELEIGLGLRQPWGSANFSVSGTQYWNDARNPNASIFGSANIRIVRGLSVNFYGGYSFIRSQRFLSAANTTQEDVLLQLRQLRTSYEYWGGFGFSYTFGSTYNNVVNPRFGGGGGTMIIMN